MNDVRPVSRADFVYETLENEILGGKIPAGEILTELRLCERLDVSRTPVREALNRLRQDGLLEETPHGLCVIGVSAEDLEDVYEVRKRIEGYATGLCAGRITKDQLTELREIVELQEFYTERGGTEHIASADSQFHEKIYAFSGSRVLYSTLTALHRKVQAYRKLSVENPARAVGTSAEHRAILEALEAHDGERAERLAIEHIENAKKNILSIERITGERKEK